MPSMWSALRKSAFLIISPICVLEETESKATGSNVHVTTMVLVHCHWWVMFPSSITDIFISVF